MNANDREWTPFVVERFSAGLSSHERERVVCSLTLPVTTALKRSTTNCLRILCVWLCPLCLLAPTSAFSQQSYARVDIRCQRSNNSITFKAADTNVAIGYVATRSDNPRATIAAQMRVSTNWTLMAFQFSVVQEDTVTLMLRGRYGESEPTGELVPEWVWVDNVSVLDTNIVDLVRNGSFEKLQHDGRPDRWGYKGTKKEMMFDKTGSFPQDGQRCIKVWHSMSAFERIRVHSNLWYTVRAYFRAE